MKRVINCAILCLWAIMLTSCGSETPSDLANKFLTAIVEKNAEEVADIFLAAYNFEEADPKDIAELKARWIKEFEEDLMNPDEKGVMVSFIIVKESISEDLQSAIVKFVAFYENDEKLEELTFSKKENGDWHIGN